MNRCLSEQPEERPSAADLVQIIAANLPQNLSLLPGSEFVAAAAGAIAMLTAHCSHWQQRHSTL